MCGDWLQRVQRCAPSIQRSSVLGFIKLPPLLDQEQVVFENASTLVEFPLRGRCDGESHNVSLHAGALNFADLQLNLGDLRPVHRALGGSLGRLCGKVAGRGACEGAINSIDSAASGGLEREMLHQVPSLLSKALSPAFAEEVAAQQPHCETFALLPLPLPTSGPLLGRLRELAFLVFVLALALALFFSWALLKCIQKGTEFRRLRSTAFPEDNCCEAAASDRGSGDAQPAVARGAGAAANGGGNTTDAEAPPQAAACEASARDGLLRGGEAYSF
eukprot:TRINITY_DN16398_c0_g1_i2.p1 TRINITY_DN16398_c0_g1~~TRINITY_DN16398_c0_g1_i2.p1  ORF type:complete len:275 (-),score=65.62 TRINITY_DN16398_c0_g1_i2:102-926(-)